MKRIAVTLLIIAGLFTASAEAENVPGFVKPDPDTPLRLPEMLYAVPEYRTQWWYFTGHLNTDSGRYGYEVTFFRVGVSRRKSVSRFAPDTFHFLHVALTDITGKTYHFRDEAAREAFDYAGAATDRLDVHMGTARLTGTIDEMHLVASVDDITLDLTLTTEKPPVLHGTIPGYSRKSAEFPTDASYYFSLTRLATSGTLTVDNDPKAVTGSSWFDRELFTDNEADIAGWDWFSLQLDDGQELMLYLLRHPDGTVDPASSGTLVDRDGGYRHLDQADFTITETDTWTSPHTGAAYPSRWRISVPDASLSLTVAPELSDQEFRAEGSTRNVYWEGACAVSGSVNGKAYVELTGYANEE